MRIKLHQELFDNSLYFKFQPHRRRSFLKAFWDTFQQSHTHTFLKIDIVQGCCNVPHTITKKSEMCINGISNSILKWALVKLAQILLWACPSFPLLQECPLHLECLCTNKRKILYTFHIILHLYSHSFIMFNVHFDYYLSFPSIYLPNKLAFPDSFHFGIFFWRGLVNRVVLCCS